MPQEFLNTHMGQFENTGQFENNNLPMSLSDVNTLSDVHEIMAQFRSWKSEVLKEFIQKHWGRYKEMYPDTETEAEDQA